MKRYDGSVYIGVAGPETDPGICRDSIHAIIQRPGDIGPNWCRATKGYEARQVHLDKMMESKADFILFLDHDMIFPADTLERLRNHGLPYVSGFYPRRDYHPVAPIWFHPYEGFWPIRPWLAPIPNGQLHPIGASGWGCILLHRDVIIAVRKVLHGERDIIEDDMDVWPYDLKAIMQAVHGLRAIADAQTVDPVWVRSVLFPALEANVGVLEKQIRPLRADNEVVGSDIRYPFYARAAGFQLMGDPDVSCGHLLNYPLSKIDWDSMINVNPQNAKLLEENGEKRIRSDARRLYKQLREVRGA